MNESAANAPATRAFAALLRLEDDPGFGGSERSRRNPSRAQTLGEEPLAHRVEQADERQGAAERERDARLGQRDRHAVEVQACA